MKNNYYSNGALGVTAVSLPFTDSDSYIFSHNTETLSGFQLMETAPKYYS